MSISHLVLVMLQALRGNQAFQVLVGLSDGLQWLMYNGHHPESRGRSDPFPSPTHAIRVAQLPPPLPQQFGTTLMPLAPSCIPNFCLLLRVESLQMALPFPPFFRTDSSKIQGRAINLSRANSRI